MKLSGFAALLAAIGPTVAVKHGTIGYGINMYHPYCCTACYDILSMLYLKCTTFEEGDAGHGMKLKKRMMGMEMMGTTSPDCYASDTPWLQTFSFCIKSKCDAEGISDSKQEKCWQKNAAGGLLVPSLQQALPAEAPTEELADDAEWLNKTMLANEASYDSDRGTIQDFETVEGDHVMFSIISLCLGIGVPILVGLWILLSGYVPLSVHQSKFIIAMQAKFSLPATFNGRHSEPLQGKWGYLPTRSITAWITIYIILNIIFSAVPYYSIQPNTWFSNRESEIGIYVANRTGVLSFANMALAMLFSMRNNPLSLVCSWTPTTFITLHRWTARLALAHAVVHSIIYTIDYDIWMSPSMYASEAKVPYFWWGIIATIAMSLMVGFSALPLRTYAYDLFLVVHIVLAILSLIGCWYHVDLRFKKRWGYEVWLYIAFAFWGGDRLLRFGKLAYYSLFNTTTAEVKLVPGTRFVLLTLRMKVDSWSPGPGMHTFIYFPSLGKFWENHPFTIADWGYGSHGRRGSDSESSSTTPDSSSEKGKEVRAVAKRVEDSFEQEELFYIRCLFRIHDGTTAKLYNKISTKPDHQARVMSEGPYGGHSMSHYSLRTADKVICIAGGIGITFAAGFAKQFGQDRSSWYRGKRMMPKCRHFTLAWTMREESLLQLVKNEMLPDVTTGGLDDGSLQYKFWVTGSPAIGRETASGDEGALSKEQTNVGAVQGHRMDVAALVADTIEADKRHVILVCGPGGLADEVRRQVVQVVSQGFVVDLIEENFAW